MKLEDLRAAPYNPREMDDAALTGLSVSLDEFGDISGVVFNRRLGYLVCGHQRLEALKRRFGDRLELQGTNSAPVLVTPDGRRYPIRVVDWDEAMSKAANVAANSEHLAGRWSNSLDEVLDDLEVELPDLSKALRFPELHERRKADDPAAPADTSVSISESYQVVVECESETDQQELYERLTEEGRTCRVLTL
ncbi:MAG: hypothetical protein IH988_05270 [Planctomycetes bacterium]|nr:hypothetical protein [Planctomycetota bacterium]